MTAVAHPKVQSAWQEAVQQCEAKFRPDDLEDIKKSTGPEEVIGFVKEQEAKVCNSKLSKLLHKIIEFGGFFKAYQNAIDLIAQGTPFPGCLIWGCIKTVLVSFRNYADIFERLLKALQTMGIRLEFSGLEIDVVIFSDFPEYSRALIGFYTSIIDFWSKALRHSKRKRIARITRAIWNNYDTDFQELDTSMSEYFNMVKECAASVHRKMAYNEQIKADAERGRVEAESKEWRQSRQDSVRAELVTWLAIGKNDANSFEQRYSAVRKSVHTGTCQWILDLAEFQSWLDKRINCHGNLLWISAAPGTGKTALCSFLIDYIQGLAGTDSSKVLYYMFDRLGKEQSTPLTASCSLVYQLLNLLEDPDQGLVEELSDYKRTKSGQEKATNFEYLWSVFMAHVQKLSEAVLVIDGLDECQDRVVFLGAIRELISNSNVNVIVLSRRESDLVPLLNEFPQIEFGHKENHFDILSWVKSVVTVNGKLSHECVREKVRDVYQHDLAEELARRAEGSFLWAKFALEELTQQATVSKIIATVQNGLPMDLSKLYISILKGYNEGFTPDQRTLCHIILRWLTCAARPLSREEFFAAVRTTYLHPALEETSDYSENVSDDEFLFERSEIEGICGSLVVISNGTVQLAHLSIAEFLRQRQSGIVGSDEIDKFFVDLSVAHSYSLNACIQVLQGALGNPPIQHKDRSRSIRSEVMSRLKPFTDYALSHWPFHLTQSNDINVDGVARRLKDFLLGPKMLYWLEVWFAARDRSLWDLEQQLDDMLRWCATQRVAHLSTENIAAFVYRWSQAVSKLLGRHGSTLGEKPTEIHFIDPRSFEGFHEVNPLFSNFISTDSSLYTQHVQLQSELFPLSELNSPTANPRHKLEMSRLDLRQLGLFYVDKSRSVIYMASYSTQMPELRCQDVKTGRTYKAMRLVCEYEVNRQYYCEGFEISPDGRLLALVYCSSTMKNGSEVEHRYDINVWELADQFDSEGHGRKTWCRMVRSSTYKRPFLGCSPQPIIFGSQCNLYCPWTIIDMSGTLSFGPDKSTHHVDAMAHAGEYDIPKHNAHLRGICFSPDRRFAIGFDSLESKIVKYFREDMSLHSVVSTASHNIMICCISYSGRFVVWRDMSCERFSCYLQDFVEKSCTCIPDGENVSFPAHVNLKFTLREDYLVGSMGNLINGDSQYVSVWSLMFGKVQQTRSVLAPAILGLHLTNIDEPAFLATLNQWIEFDPSRLHLLPDYLDPDRHERPHITSEVSVKGDKLALLYTTHQRCELELFDLSAGHKVHRSQFQLHVSQPVDRLYRVAFSPGLEFVILNDKIYNLCQETESVKPVQLPIPVDSGEIRDQDISLIDNRTHSQATFSACNGFLVYLYTGSAVTQRPPKIQMYRMRRPKHHLSQKMTLPINLDLSAFKFAMAKWHPASPILSLITWRSVAVADSEDFIEVKACHTIDMESPNGQWVKAKEVYSDRLSLNLKASDPGFNESAMCYSLCGTWVSLRSSTGHLKVGPWTVHPKCIGRISPLRFPRIAYPQQAITSMLWGSHRVFLYSANRDGRFELVITDAKFFTSMTLIDQLLPSYLTDVVPVIIFDWEQSSNIQLVFRCHDRAPEVMILSQTWDSIYAQCQEEAKQDKLLISKKIGPANIVGARTDNFRNLLSIQARCLCSLRNHS